MDEFDVLLLSAVREGDVISLKTHLSTVIDPNLYLNRVYDESNEQKCTLFMIACLNGYEDIVNMLLNCFKPNLEVLNVIKINDNHQKQIIYYNVTVLWAAAAIDNFSIVKKLIEHGADINHKTDTNSTALRCACYSGNVLMARYLIENGAHVHIDRKNNDTNLALCVYWKHLEVTTYLVDELGCDINECDTDGRSPLHFAVRCGSLEIIQFLLDRGARNFPALDDYLSPLMLAAEKRRNDLMDVIIPYCSLLESIEAEELLGSAFACAEHGTCDLEQSFEHFCRALELRSTHHFPKALRETSSEVFDNRQECQTIDQLKELRSNPDDIHAEALLVRERLLGPTSAKYQYSLIYRGAILADNAQYYRAVALWLYELELHKKYSIPLDAKCLRQFPSIFSEMVTNSSLISIETILTVITAVLEELKNNTKGFDDNLRTMLFLTTIVSQPSIEILFSGADHRVFYKLLHFINKNRYVTQSNASSLLHLCLNDCTSAFDSFIDRNCKYPCLLTARTLLKYGADINVMDAVRNTPLHVFVSNPGVCDKTILQLLCDAGAHLDCVNALGETPIEIAPNSRTKQLLKAKMKLSLKCLCARLIQKNNVPFLGKISTSLVSFVEKH